MPSGMYLLLFVVCLFGCLRGTDASVEGRFEALSTDDSCPDASRGGCGANLLQRHAAAHGAEAAGQLEHLRQAQEMNKTTCSFECSSICTITDPSMVVKVVNLLGVTTDVSLSAGMYGGCKWNGGIVPPCLSRLAPGASGSLQMLSCDPGWGFAWFVADSNGGDKATRFELTTNSQYAYDVSLNAGYNFPMTVTAPSGGVEIVCTGIGCPAGYQLGTSGCQVQPCSSPTFGGPPGIYTVYFGNRPGDQDTPGPCGCQSCPGISCTEGSAHCTTSGSGIYCLTGGPNCPTETLPPGTTCGGAATTTAAAGTPAAPGSCDANCVYDGGTATCSSRVAWLESAQGGGLSSSDAVDLVNEECAGQCSCSGGSPTQSPTPAAPVCTSTPCEYQGDSATCLSRVQWLMDNEAYKQSQAIATVNSECAGQCSCQSGKPECTNTPCVLQGDTGHTCLSRVQWLMDNEAYSQSHAISTVNSQCDGQCSCSSDVFPDSMSFY